MTGSGMISKYAARFGLAGICGLGVCAAQAADFTVNDLTDAVDANPGDGICEVTAMQGDCTLRAAIMEANASIGVADTITVPAGTITLSIPGVDETWSVGAPGDPPCPNPYVTATMPNDFEGDLDITGDLTITGAGADQTLVEWAAPAAPDTDPATGDRIFHVQTTAATGAINSVVIQDLAVRNGEVGLVPTDATSYAATGTNAYDIEWDDTVPNELKICQFRRMGGAIGLGLSSAVVYYEETVHGPGGAPVGGGDMGGPFPGGKPGEDDAVDITGVTLNRVAVVTSWAGADGGGIYSAVPATINESIVSGNTSGANGGGIYNDAGLALTDTTVGRLFDVAAPAELMVENAAENGGGMFDTGSHITTITGSAFNGNSAIGGGGIAVRAGITIDMDNSTVSTNTATDVGGGIINGGTVNLRNVTVMDNSSDSDAPGGGAGLNSFGFPGVFNFANTVLQNNQKLDNATKLPVTVNCGCSGGGLCTGGEMVTGGNNLEDGDTCDMAPAVSQDLINTLANLGLLADNGGLTETHAIDAPSPAIDAGSNVVCQQAPALATDQRGTGFPRTTDGNGDRVAVCDIGAFERAGAVFGSGGGCVAGTGRGFDPLFPLFLALAGIYGSLRFRRSSR